MSVMFRNEAGRQAVAKEYERFALRVPGTTSRRTVMTRFGKTHVLCAGNPNKPALVLVHGALASSAHATAELGPLLDEHYVYAIDVIGQSAKSEDARVDLDSTDYAEWMIDVLDALGLQRPVVYGISWGGFVACKLAEHAPERIARLVLMVPAGVVAGSLWEGFTKAALPLTLYRLFPNQKRLRAFMESTFTDPDEQWVRYFGIALDNYKLDLRAPPLFKDGAFKNWKGPTLLFAAKQDLSFPGSEMIARFKALIPHAETEILDCRHSPPSSKSFRALMAARIGRFLDVTLQ